MLVFLKLLVWCTNMWNQSKNSLINPNCLLWFRDFSSQDISSGFWKKNTNLVHTGHLVHAWHTSLVRLETALKYELPYFVIKATILVWSFSCVAIAVALGLVHERRWKLNRQLNVSKAWHELFEFDLGGIK